MLSRPWHSNHERGARMRVSGGARVSRLRLIAQPGKRSLISRFPTARTFGLAGFCMWKSYHRIRPSCLTTLNISNATRLFRSGSRMDVKTVTCMTTSKESERSARAPPSPQYTRRPLGTTGPRRGGYLGRDPTPRHRVGPQPTERGPSTKVQTHHPFRTSVFPKETRG